MRALLRKLTHIQTSEQQDSSLPAILVTLVIALTFALEGLFSEAEAGLRFLLVLSATVFIFYILVVIFFLLPRRNRKPYEKWIVFAADVVILGLFIVLERFIQISLVPLLISMLCIAMAIQFGRWPAYLLALSCFILDRWLNPFEPGLSLLEYLAASLPIPIITIVAIETISRWKDLTNHRVSRLQALNMVARSVGSTLETNQITALLNSAIQMALDADTYYVGLMKNSGFLRLELLFDEGEFYPPSDLPLENTLAGWVINHRKSLFLVDLQNEMPALEIKRFVVGKPRPSASWMGTCLVSGERLIGLVAVASYQKHAFSREDLELLENVAQLASLALDNAYHHAEVELKSRLDSLTGVLNHRSFLSGLENKVADAALFNQPLSVIMLDIDHFKKYNDSYGHLVGDQVLSNLTSIIGSHIRDSDLVGRWGGEEFSMALPNTTLPQAHEIATRIQKSLSEVQFASRDGTSIPPPTVSQGISICPEDARECFPLIDIADQRLYIAKNRGRNEIEPRF